MNHTQLFFHKHNNKELTLEGGVACNHYKKIMVELKKLSFKFHFYNLSLHLSNDHKREHVYCEF
jgi:tRNA A37 threonylcarbamoyltransferase TsaD